MKKHLSFSMFDSFNVLNVVSTRDWSSINPFVGYEALTRLENGLQLDQAKNILSRIVFAEQVHGSNVHICNKYDAGSIRLGVDALISNIPNHILAIYSADCIPLLLFDPQNRIFGAVHAGYRGLSKGIIANCIEAFEREFDSNKSNILIGIAPFIHVCCYEVKEDIFDFLECLNWMIFVKEKNGKFFLDLTPIVYQELMKNGILEKNIEDANICTSCRKDILFSARKRDIDDEKGSSIVTLISLVK